MMPEQYERVIEVFLQASQYEGEARRRFLRASCREDADLFRRVEAMLTADENSGNFLEEPPDDVAADLLTGGGASIVGQRLGQYDVIERVGAGGMGEVFHARDRQLGRSVALKLLRREMLEDAAAIVRFRREARMLATVDHENIATIYGFEEHKGIRFLVLEYVPGPTLADRLRGGRLPLDEAFAMAEQIAKALAHAHERGLVHRDLKPSNIKVTHGGRVKLLDFGVAKALQSGAATASNQASLTRVVSNATDAGVLIGTVAYMSPEQVRGQTVDRRTDVWAFGVVLYEMLTSRCLFERGTTSDTIAAVLKSDIDMSGIPTRVRAVIDRCLRRDPDLRWHCMGDVRLALEESTQCERKPEGHTAPVAWMVTSAILASLAITMSWCFWRAARPGEHPLTRLTVDLGPEAIPGFSTTIAISPNGRRIVFPVRKGLATRLLDQPIATLLPGTANSRDPFFSPDGEWVGFFADGKLEKISVQGGVPVVICDAARPRGGSWGEDNNVVVALSSVSSLARVSASGGTVRRVTTLVSGEVTHRWPQVLPGGEAVLFTAAPSNVGMADANLKVVLLKTGATKIVQRGGYYGRYLPSGHLVYVHQGVLFAARFDVDRLEMRGTPTPIVEGIAGDAGTGGGQFDFSRDGTFVYLPVGATPQSWPIVWLDGSGRTQPLLATPRAYHDPRLSPNLKSLAFTVLGTEGSDVYAFDRRREGLARLTFDRHSSGPIWYPDGRHIAYRSTSGGFAILWVRADGAGEPQYLLKSHGVVVPWSFSPEGKRLAYFEASPDTGYDLWTLPLDVTNPDHPVPGKPDLYLRTQADELLPTFSPNGRWVAYRSHESGANEIYVRTFPSPGGKWQVSSGGGMYALWSKTSHNLFYATVDNRIMVVRYTANGDSLSFDKPRPWSSRNIFNPPAGLLNLDLASDSDRLAVLAPDNSENGRHPVHVTFLQHFFDELNRRVPLTGK